jgi:hypothetical protein
VSIQAFLGCVPLIKHLLPDFYVHGMGDPRIEHMSPLAQGRLVMLSKASVFGAIHNLVRCHPRPEVVLIDGLAFDVSPAGHRRTREQAGTGEEISTVPIGQLTVEVSDLDGCIHSGGTYLGPFVTLYSNPGICPDWLFCCT